MIVVCAEYPMHDQYMYQCIGSTIGKVCGSMCGIWHIIYHHVLCMHVVLTLQIANIGPASYNWDETLNTLRYANRCAHTLGHHFMY